jgi:hypothetical protein
MMRWFRFLHQVFNNSKHSLKRKYFPPMQYMVLRLLQEKCNAVAPYKIPIARTVRKRNSLALVYDTLINGEIIEDTWVVKRRCYVENSIYA